MRSYGDSLNSNLMRAEQIIISCDGVTFAKPQSHTPSRRRRLDEWSALSDKSHLSEHTMVSSCRDDEDERQNKRTNKLLSFHLSIP